jgi:hypothetical protein
MYLLIVVIGIALLYGFSRWLLGQFDEEIQTRWQDEAPLTEHWRPDEQQGPQVLAKARPQFTPPVQC